MPAFFSYPAPFQWNTWAGPRDAKIVFVGEAWGQSENACFAPFVGAAGQEFWRMLGEAMPEVFPELHSKALRAQRTNGLGWIAFRNEWLNAASIAFTNVFGFQPPDNKITALCGPKEDKSRKDGALAGPGLYLLPEFFPHVDRLWGELSAAPRNLIVPLGNTACWAVLGQTAIGLFRGAVTLRDGQKILPTYHPAGVLRQWSWRTIVITDLMKAQREGQFANFRRPSREIMVNPSLEELAEGVERVWKSLRPDGFISFDCETSFGQVTEIAFSSDPGFAVVCPFVDRRQANWSYWPTADQELTAWRLVKELLESPRAKIGQNKIYDIQYLTKIGVCPQGCDDDLMIFHHGVFPEMLKGLGFLGSVYTNEPSWKLMRTQKADTEKRDE